MAFLVVVSSQPFLFSIVRGNLWNISRLCVKRAVYRSRLDFYVAGMFAVSKAYFYANRRVIRTSRPFKCVANSVEMRLMLRLIGECARKDLSD